MNPFSHSYLVPEDWIGEWRDQLGRRLTIKRHGDFLLLTMRSGATGETYPIPGRMGERTEDMPALVVDEFGMLQIRLKTEVLGLGDTLLFEAFIEEGGELRRAKLSDPGALVVLKARVEEGELPGAIPTSLSWAYPLKEFKKYKGN